MGQFGKMKRGIYICDNKHSLVWIKSIESYIHVLHINFTNDYYFNAGKCFFLSLSFNTSGIIHFSLWNQSYSWHFKDAFDTTVILLRVLKHKLGKDISYLVAKAVWKTRNDLAWGHSKKQK